jgi:hypothetical protein
VKIHFIHACALSFLVAGLSWSATPAKPGADENPGHLRMALVNIRSRFTAGGDAARNAANLNANLQRHLYFIDKAVERGAEFVGFPELSLSGYQFAANMPWLRRDGPEVKALAAKAKEHRVYVSAGMAEEDADGKRWNTHFVLGPDGEIVGWHHKVWLTAERGHTERGTDHNVFEVKGAKMGISTCADGSDYKNLKALADNGAWIIYGPHANTTGSTIAGWYGFRAKWGGKWDGTTAKMKTSNDGPEAEVPAGGWIDQLGVYAALHNHAAHYDPAFDPPPPAGRDDAPARWASGAWFIGPEGQTLAQMKPSKDRGDSREYILVYNVPLQPPPRPTDARPGSPPGQREGGRQPPDVGAAVGD